MDYVYGTYNAELIIYPFASIACNDTLCTMNLESYTTWINLCSSEHHERFDSWSCLTIQWGNKIIQQGNTKAMVRGLPILILLSA